MSNYEPKDGDSVKATLGDSVLYGTYVIGQSDGLAYIGLATQGVYPYALIPLGREWALEPWTPPVEFKPLTVVRISEGAALYFSRYGSNPYVFAEDTVVYRPGVDDEWYSVDDYPVDSWGMDEDVARFLAAGEAEVLFAGVDRA
jgi:hypothetical protein